MATTRGDRPMRADARRNYERLLTTASEAFREHGLDTSLEDIARGAGVGIGTLYRHFPDRFALMEAVFEDQIDRMGEEASRLTDDASQSPLQALRYWLRAYMEHAMEFRGMSSALLEEGRLANCHLRLKTYAQTLTDRAHASGELSPSANYLDILRIANALAYATEKAAVKSPEDTDLSDRLLTLAFEGLRTR
ncbi:TetR/AcrR family transcriptional regulator [Streptomyces sp. NPDC051940]|uniref:TetR/AcrR family transcriptional regulator n=1 Tax=Streptomyces sp. NPDC051940 TaxID=3155675 RepID=UPI00342902D3